MKHVYLGYELRGWGVGVNNGGGGVELVGVVLSLYTIVREVSVWVIVLSLGVLPFYNMSV